MDTNDFMKLIIDDKKDKSLILQIQDESIPLVIWGAGSMSESIRKLLFANKITLDACLIDNANVKEIYGLPVYNLLELKQKYQKFNIICGHSKYEMTDKLVQDNSVNKIFCLVNVTYGQWKGINYDFVKEHSDDYFRTYSMLEDDYSRKCLISYLNCKINEDYHYILPVTSEIATYFQNPFFSVGDNENYIDAGAYNGDTIKDFLKHTQGSYEHIYAIEPEEKSFADLDTYISTNNLDNVSLFKCGLWNSDAVLNFSHQKEASGFSEIGDESMKVFRLDSLLDRKKISILKINYLYGLKETLLGAEEILKLQKPNLAIAIGHDEWGLIEIPKLIKEINPEYKISLRYAAAMPSRLILFAY